ncbi:MAG: hypothetical protein CSA34_01695 [Desulfobulbus propionicus]|nr:MAG: hypothetical protein CSA34_01695 [Desulfobulbus propionicus]
MDKEIASQDQGLQEGAETTGEDTPAGETVSGTDYQAAAGQPPGDGPQVAASTAPPRAEYPGQWPPLPPGYLLDPATGQPVFVGWQPPYTAPGPVYVHPPPPTAEELAAQQAAAQQRYGQIVSSVEQFINGEANVGEVVKTLYTNTAQDEQFWKGLLVGAAASVLLSSEPVRNAMGKNFGGLFPGLKKNEEQGPAPAKPQQGDTPSGRE